MFAHNCPTVGQLPKDRLNMNTHNSKKTFVTQLKSCCLKKFAKNKLPPIIIIEAKYNVSKETLVETENIIKSKKCPTVATAGSAVQTLGKENI